MGGRPQATVLVFRPIKPGYILPRAPPDPRWRRSTVPVPGVPGLGTTVGRVEGCPPPTHNRQSAVSVPKTSTPASGA